MPDAPPPNILVIPDHDLAAGHPDRAAAMAEAHRQWADRCGVIDREKILAVYRRRQ